MKSVVFWSFDEFNPGDPDFDYVRQVVAKALAAPTKHRHHHAKDPAETDKDACAYHRGQSY